ncbi:MAG: serine O-acetyltransferase, partial [Porticoccaceae bacterium]
MTNTEHSAMADQVWQNIRSEAQQTMASEPVLAPFLQATLLDHGSMGEALSFHLANKLASSAMPASMLRDIMSEVFAEP